MAVRRWFAVVRRDTGQAESFGTRVADGAVLNQKGLDVVDLGDHEDPGPDQQTQRWDPATRRFVARVVKDRLEDLQTSDHPDAVAFRQAWASLGAGQRTGLRTGLLWLLGPFRYRQDDEPITLG